MGYLLQDLQVVSRGCREVHEDVHVQRDVRCRCHCHGERLLVACNSMQQPVQQDVMVPPTVRAQTGCTGQPGLRVASTWWGRTWTFPVVSSSYQGGGGEGEGDHNKCSTQAEATMECIYFSCTPYTGPRARVVHPERTSSGMLR